MTITARPLDDWTITKATALDHSGIADFQATTEGLGGRKFAADSRDVAEQLAGVFPDGASVVRDRAGRVRGYSALHPPHGVDRGEVTADFVFDPAVPPNVVDDVVGAVVVRFVREADVVPGAYLRVFTGSDGAVVDALVRRGARREGSFIRARKALGGEDPAALEALSIDGVTVLSWAKVVARGLGEQVRRLQYDTFLEHFGNMSKTPEAWHQHLHSRMFTPDYSVAAIDDDGEAVGYVLGSTYTVGRAGAAETSAHTDYIGVRRDRRKRGIAELLLAKVWLAALRRGFTLASLGTDVNNRSNAHLLYARLGYVTAEKQAAYRIDAQELK